MGPPVAVLTAPNARHRARYWRRGGQDVGRAAAVPPRRSLPACRRIGTGKTEGGHRGRSRARPPRGSRRRRRRSGVPGLQGATRPRSGLRLARRVRASASSALLRGPQDGPGVNALPSMPRRHARRAHGGPLQPRRPGRVLGRMRSKVHAQPVERGRSLCHVPQRAAAAGQRASPGGRNLEQAQLHRRPCAHGRARSQPMLRLRGG